MQRALGWVTGMMLVVSAVGCQDKVMQDNRDLHTQNRELQARLDEAHRQPEPAAATAPPTPQPPVIIQQTAPAPLAPLPTAAAPKPDLGGLETTEDLKAGTTTVNLPGDVFFDPGKDQIKDSAKPTLDKLVAALKKEYDVKMVRVEGYTDTDPIKHSHWKSNQELSEARASAVRDYFVKMGVPASRLSIKGFGDTMPKGTKALSRRVEVVVLNR